METQPLDPMQTHSTSAEKKPYVKPALRREASLPVVTAGSFDLVIPNG